MTELAITGALLTGILIGILIVKALHKKEDDDRNLNIRLENVLDQYTRR